MLVRDKKVFVKGVVLLVTFLVVLVLMFLPLFAGRNSLEAADRLFNSICKRSIYILPDVIKKNELYKGKTFSANVKFKYPSMPDQASRILKATEAKVSPSEAQFKVEGDLGTVLGAALSDSDAMFRNREQEVSARYGLSGKEALFCWWNLLKEVEKDLRRRSQFKEADWVSDVVNKGVEPGYNYFGIESESAGSEVGILTFSLIFYVIYTLWWGVAIMYLFEGMGLQLRAGAKKEV